MRWRFASLGLLTLSLATAGQHAAFADAATEAQLRTALQGATAQIAQLEDQVANLQASQAPDVATIEALHAQLATLQAGSGKPENAPANDAALAALKRQLAAQQNSLAKTRSQYQVASQAASHSAQENSALQAQLAATKTGLGSCIAKNAKLFALGNEILDAYSQKDNLFASVAAREPFTGLKRVQLQNIVQDDQDKLYDNQITPAP